MGWPPWGADGRLAAVGAAAALGLGRHCRAAALFDQLAAAGIAVRGLPLPDHAPLSDLPWPLDAADVIVTEKDAVKLDPARVRAERQRTCVWVATLDFQPDPAFWCDFEAALPEALRRRLLARPA